MAVVPTGELFINSTWTEAKVKGKKTPGGVELKWGDNAFAKLEDAIEHAVKTHMDDVKYFDGDKVVAFSDAAGEVTYIASKEIYGTETVKPSKTGTTNTAQSKQTAANKITISNVSSGATVAGFKDVTLNGGTAEFTVLGGANTVTHVFAVNSTTKNSTRKDSGSISGKADGTLTVSGAKVVSAGGAWAEFLPEDENKDEITSGAAVFLYAKPGDDPKSSDWEPSTDTLLDEMPGFATVTLAGGASGAVLRGGTLNFSHVTDSVDTASGGSSYLSSLTKSMTYNVKNSGKLTVTDAVVEEARGYSTVTVTGKSADFGTLDNTNVAETVKTTYKDTRSAKNTTVKTTEESSKNTTAAGTLTVDGIGSGGAVREVKGFAKVTVKDARLGDLDATNIKLSSSTTVETVTTPIAGGSSVQVTEKTVSSGTFAAGGTLTTAKGSTNAEFGMIYGFNKVELANATVTYNIQLGDGRDGRVGNYNLTDNSTTVGGKVMQSKTSFKEDYAAAGTVTMSGGSVEAGIYGAATVKLTGTAVGGGILGGGTVKVNYSDELSLNSKTGALTSSYSSSTANQLKGAVTLTGNTVSALRIQGYQTVTLDGATITGDIGNIGYLEYDEVAANQSVSSSFRHEFSDSFDGGDGKTSGGTLVKQTYSSGYAYAPTAAITLKNGAAVNGSVYGVKTLTLNSGAAIAGEADMQDTKEQTTASITSKGGIYTETYQSSSVRGAVGTVTATGAAVGDITAAGKVTATDATAALGDIDAVSRSVVEKYTRTGSALDKDGGRYFISSGAVLSENFNRTASVNAVGNATLTRTDAGELVGVGTVKLTSGAIVAASAGNSKSIESSVSSATVFSSVTSDTWNTIGNFNATGATVSNGAIGYSTVTLDNTKVLAGGVGGLYDEYEAPKKIGSGLDMFNYSSGSEVVSYGYGSKNISGNLKQTFASGGALLTQNLASAYTYAPTVALTLKSGAAVSGDLYGIKTLTLGAGTAVDGNVAMGTVTSKLSDAITSNKKTGLYEEKKQSSFIRSATGTVTLTGTSGATVQVCGDIDGANKVTATDVIVGNLSKTCSVESCTYTGKGSAVEPVSSGAAIYGLTSVTEYTSVTSTVQSAAGNATLTRTSAGQLVGYATVKLTGGEIVGAEAGTTKTIMSMTSNGDGMNLNFSSSTAVQGTFTATDAALTGSGAVLTGFATVNLTNVWTVEDDTAIIGGSKLMTMIMSGGISGMTMSSTSAAAGTLTANRALLNGAVVSNYATVTLTDCSLAAVVVDSGNTAKTALNLNGNNDLYWDGAGSTSGSGGIGSGGIGGGSGGIGGIGKKDPVYAITGFANVTVKNGFTMVLGEYGGYNGTSGNDTVTVNAKSDLILESDMLFGEGTDGFTVNGTARVGGDFDAGNLEKLSGSGMLVINDAGAKALRDSIDAGTTKLSGKLNIVAAGREADDVLAVRTKAEELADNTADKAQLFAGRDMVGWLSGVEDEAAWKFADTEDWISFLNYDYDTYEIGMTDVSRQVDLTVEVYKDGAKVAGEVVKWEDDRFVINNSAFAPGEEYQLRLTTAAETSAFSYVFGVKALG